jgi:hypothetical protein
MRKSEAGFDYCVSENCSFFSAPFADCKVKQSGGQVRSNRYRLIYGGRPFRSSLLNNYKCFCMTAESVR